jgi:hypothetical protein
VRRSSVADLCDRWLWFQTIFSEVGPVSPTARNVLGVVFAYTSNERSHVWPAQTTIAKRARLSTRQVRRVLERLEAEGWIYREIGNQTGKKWRTTVYWPTLPAGLQVDERPWEKDAQFTRGRAATQMSPRPSGNPANGAATQMSPPGEGQTPGERTKPVDDVRTLAIDVRTSRAKVGTFVPLR